MLKIIAGILITALPLFNCSNSGKGKVPTGFVTQDFTAKTPLSGNKAYSFTTGSGINESCSPSTRCAAVYYSGSIGNAAYTGVAADSKMSGGNSNFNIMIYKSSTDESYTVKVLNNFVLFSSDSVSSSAINIADNGDNTFTVTFTSAISLGSVSIGTGDYIVAQGQ